MKIKKNTVIPNVICRIKMVKKKDCGKCSFFEAKCNEKYEKLLVKQQETLIKNLIKAFPEYKVNEDAMMKYVRKVNFKKELNKSPLNLTYRKLVMENGTVYYYNEVGYLVDENEKFVGYVDFGEDGITVNKIIYPDNTESTENSIKTLNEMLDKLDSDK